MTVERVVFLPGASGDASFWAPVAERLPRQLDRVLLAWPGLGNEYPAAAAWIFDASIDLTDRIRTITTPTLLLWGDADPISPVAVGEHLASLLPRADLVMIPGGNHAFARDRADEVAPYIVRHLGAA